MSETVYQVMIVELDDVVPRRCSEYPNLYVGKVVQDPYDKFESLKTKRSQSWYSGHEVRLRDDLMDFVPYLSKSEADEAVRETTERLMAVGYTVNQNTTVWSVYVVELDKAAMSGDGIGYVYVGETSKPHEQRLQEHLTRARNSKTRLFSSVVAKHGVRLRPDLAPTAVHFSKQASKAAEVAWAEHLRRLRYVVEGGH